MSFTYKPLWKMLIDKDMTKKQLMETANISKSTMDKMARNEYVALSVLDRICCLFDCDVCDVIAHQKELIIDKKM